MLRLVIALQALVYLATGLWPMLDMASFEAATGPKTDEWLVHLVGALAIAIALALITGLRNKQPSRETMVLSILAALSFAAIDVFYVSRDVIRPVYLTDAAGEILVVILVALLGLRARREAPRRYRS